MQGRQFYDAKDLDEILRANGVIPNGGTKFTSYGEICNFRQTTRYRPVSETVQDRHGFYQYNVNLYVIYWTLTLPMTLGDPNHPKSPHFKNQGTLLW